MSSCIYCNTTLTGKSKKFCNNKCQQDYQYSNYITEWINGNQSGSKYIGEVSNYVRRWLHEKHETKCQQCGWGVKHPITGKVPLQVNHIDGDSNNHRPDNLELLCPNCHSLTPNYGSLNNGKGRTKR